MNIVPSFLDVRTNICSIFWAKIKKCCEKINFMGAAIFKMHAGSGALSEVSYGRDLSFLAS